MKRKRVRRWSEIEKKWKEIERGGVVETGVNEVSTQF